GDKIFNVYTNSLGFKDKEIKNINKQSDRKRILFLGDSFTEGIGMTWDESFVGILQEKHPELELLNAAVVSYSPMLYYLKLRYLLEQQHLKIDEVFVFIDNSDPLNEITYRDFIPYPNNKLKIFFINIKRFLFGHSYLYYSLSEIFLKNRRNPVTESWNRAKGGAFVDEVASSPDDFIAAISYWSLNPETYSIWGKKGLDLAGENMANLAGLCKVSKIKLNIVIYPWPALIRERSLENVQVKYWEAFCNKANLKFINLYPAFINPAGSDFILREYFISGDVHWNESGHRYVAELISPYL
ncbi:MAG: hypothetical protein JW731_12245, partial [Bacteroidales bacterium]|nr:hypothetical protein [Bacteroidales bacterium]